MLNIVVPMAGLGSRFAAAGFSEPKPLISVFGRPMIELVIHNLRPEVAHRFIFICLRAHDSSHGLKGRLQAMAPGCKVVLTDGLTAGAACSVLLARQWIDGAHPLLVANCDQYVDVSIDDFLASQSHAGLDGLIMTMPASDPKWSFVRRGPSGLVEEVREKAVISSEATVGLYLFARGADFVHAARAMVARDERVHGEFYVAPVYNDIIGAGGRIGAYDIGTRMHGIGTPADLAGFLARFSPERLRRSLSV